MSEDIITWEEFGSKYFDRRILKSLTKVMGMDKPTLVQMKCIPLALEGKDILCKAKTGSGKTLAYLIPLIHKILENEKKDKSLRGVILVPTKELCVQVYQVIKNLLSFSYDELTCDYLLAGQKYAKQELPTILISSPSSLTQLLKQRERKLNDLEMLIVDEADLMATYGYAEDMEQLKHYLPSNYQAILCSATLSDEVDILKALVLHKPVILKLEQDNSSLNGGLNDGILTQYYLPHKQDDKWLILYSLIKLNLVNGKILLFVKDIDSAYGVKLFFEKFGINSAVLNSDLSFKSRQNVIQSFNQDLVKIVIATDEGFEEGKEEENVKEEEMEEMSEPSEGFDTESEEEEEDNEEEEEENQEPAKKKAKKSVQEEDEEGSFGEAFSDIEEEEVNEDIQDNEEEEEEEEEEEDSESVSDALDAAEKKLKGISEQDKKKAKKAAENSYSITRGLDFKEVGTVLNFDMPKTVRSYIHRVGRTCRGGSDGTSLSLVDVANEKDINLITNINDNMEALFNEKSTHIINGDEEQNIAGIMNQLPLKISDIDRLRYRVNDVKKSVTQKSIKELRSRDLQQEALNSIKLQSYFEDNPNDLKALQRAQREFKDKKSTHKHLQYLPSYLIPDTFMTKNATEQAIIEQTGNLKRQKNLSFNKNGLKNISKGRKGKNKVTPERMQYLSKRQGQNEDVDRLVPLGGGKIWKMNKGKVLKNTVDKEQFIAGRKFKATLKRKKRFPGLS